MPEITAPTLLADIGTATVAQAGQRRSEDAWLVRRRRPLVLAVADGAGRAEGAAHRAIHLLDRNVGRLRGDRYRSFAWWCRLLGILDNALRDGPEVSLLAVALLDDRIYGAAVGSPRAYLRHRDGRLELLNQTPSPVRLGRGRLSPTPIHAPFAPGDTLALLTDGAWRPFSLDRLRDHLARRALGRVPELAEATVAEATRAGRGDDATALIVRRRAPPSAPVREPREVAMGDHIHGRTLVHLAAALKGDSKWWTGNERRLEWFGDGLRAELTIGAPRKVAGMMQVRLACSTTIVEEVREIALARHAAATLDPWPVAAALVFDPVFRRLSLVTTMHVEPVHKEFHADLFCWCMSYQRMRGRALRDDLATKLGGRPPRANHPFRGPSGPGEEHPIFVSPPDRPRGDGPWQRPDLDLALAVRQPPWVEVLDRWEDWFEAELPGGGTLRMEVGAVHPQFGRGLLAELRPRLFPPDPAEAVWRLNRAEARLDEHFGLLGGWTLDDAGALVFRSFAPDTFYIRGLPEFLAWWAGRRNAWAVRHLPRLLDPLDTGEPDPWRPRGGR